MEGQMKLLGIDKSKVFIFNKEFETKIDFSPRVAEVSAAFGIGINESKKFKIYDSFNIGLDLGDVVYITGDSGSGKSLLINLLKEKFLDYVDINNIVIPNNEVLVNGVGKTTEQALQILASVGISDAFIFLRKYCELSDGQKYRYRLAKLIDSDSSIWFADEFCAVLDRETARVVAYNFQKVCRKRGATLIVATTHYDLFDDLRPNVYVVKGFGEKSVIKYFKDIPKFKCSLSKEIVISEGNQSDYEKLSEFHYRGHDLGILKKVFKASLHGELVGVIVYCYPKMALKGRGIAFDKYFYSEGRPDMVKVNSEISLISRVVINPKYRAIGLGYSLVKDTLPLAGTRVVEALAVMGRYNPFFERAGMTKVETKSDIVEKLIRFFSVWGFDCSFTASKDYNLQVMNNMDEQRFNNFRVVLSSVSRAFAVRRMAMSSLDMENYVSDVLRMDKDKLALLIADNNPLETVYYFWVNPDFVDLQATLVGVKSFEPLVGRSVVAVKDNKVLKPVVEMVSFKEPVVERDLGVCGNCKVVSAVRVLDVFGVDRFLCGGCFVLLQDQLVRMQWELDRVNRGFIKEGTGVS